MAIAPFGEWLPDQPPFNAQGVHNVLNVMPSPGAPGYLPVPSVVLSEDTPLPGAPLGGAIVTLPGGLAYTYAGTATGLYLLSGSGWTDVSKPGGYALSVGDRWQFAQYQKQIIACCGSSVAVQVADIGGASFGDLATSDRKPRAKAIGLVNGWPILGSTFDSQDGEQPSRLWWPQLVLVPNIREWDPDLTTQANYTVATPQAADGDVVRIIDGPVGIIFCKRAIYRMRYVNIPDIFEFDRIARGRGAISPGAVADHGGMSYFIDEDGIYQTDGESVAPIGHSKVDVEILRRLNKAAAGAIESSVFPDKSVVIWALPLDGAEAPNALLMYAWKDGRFSTANIAASYIGEIALPGVSFDQSPWSERALDQEPWASYVWDSQEFMGGQRALSTIRSDGVVGYMSGTPLPAEIETQEVSPGGTERVAEITEVRPIVTSGGGVTVSVGTRASVTDPVSWGPWTTLNQIGYAPVRARGRFTRARIRIESGFEHAYGIDFLSRPGGRR